MGRRVGKSPRESRTEMTEVILPSDSNPLGTVFGGRVMQWIDLCGAVAAGRHCRRAVVTASMDDLHFHAPMRVGEIAVLEGQVLASFRTSMEVSVVVRAENPLTGERRLCTTAFMTFVAVGADGRPVPVPKVLPESEEEELLRQEASLRREARLAHRRQEEIPGGRGYRKS